MPRMIVRGQLHGDVLEVGRALGPQIDDDVEDRAAACSARASSRRPADTGSACRAACPCAGSTPMLACAMTGFSPCCRELVLAEGAGKEPALVLARFEVDDERALQFRLSEKIMRACSLRPRTAGRG